MPTPVPPTFTNGTVMDSAAVVAALADAKDYLNGGIVTADFADDAIGTETLARPLISAEAPESASLEGAFQGVYGRQGGIGDNPAPEGERDLTGADSILSKEALRRPIYPKTMGKGDFVPIEGLVQRFDVFGDGKAEVFATAKLEMVDVSATSEECGNVHLRYRNVDSDNADAGTEIGGSRRGLDQLDSAPSATPGKRQATRLITFGSFTVYQGTWDVWVAYGFGDATRANLYQIIVSDPNIMVEVHEGEG